jgi:hypothetical protein
LTVVLTLLPGPPVSQAAVDDYRITADRDANSFILGVNEPLQVHVNQGQTRTFSFDQPVIAVISRNPTVARLTVKDGAIEAHGLLPGRTGMRITFLLGGPTLYMGLRVDHPDGSLPGLPGPVALASVSGDTANEVAFWQDHVPGPTGTRIDIRYIYLNGGPFTGWANWGERVKTSTKNSLLWGMIPFFVFYNIPEAVEDYPTDLANVQSSTYMTAYYANLDLFLTQAKTVMQGELYGAVLEPDFLGYMQQQSGKQPSEITTADGTLVDTVTRINQTIAQAKADGQNILFGWQLNLWADPSVFYNKGVIRITDSEGWGPGRNTIVQAATNTVNYAMAAGVLTHDADFLSIDKYGLDAAGDTRFPYDPANPFTSAYFWNNDHWINYLLFVKTVFQVSGKPVVLWQMPVGHINSSTAISARTGALFPNLDNTLKYYEDSSTSFFFGDVFDASSSSSVRRDYFSQNQANDPTLKVSGNLVTWGSHLEILPQYGVISAMFGAGVPASTQGIPPAPPPPDTPTDAYFWIQKVQMYYDKLEHNRIAAGLVSVYMLLMP